MSTQLKGAAVRQLALGIQVVRAAALQPGTAYGALFNILGGKVLVTSLIGEVIVATPATANVVKVTGTPTTGTAVDWTTTTSTASKEVGSTIALPNAAGGALAVANAGGGLAVDPTGYVAQIGTVGITTSGTAATGTITWSLTYVPLDTGASVTAA